ncbi:hypothetical protein NG697_16240 [Pseudarthrobacter sp. MDT3-26]|uniref:hypothetical protein n=1 Tax=Pseudarthrobacter raffinosi TaxID=2953651 RepID=UPI00208FD29C|nr:hypothetical protein [Pseudarthrobacter sp. MDT3-26]MCO4264451.1 hypothetical protein [Pseudarthrobacter sp. MDT3-26]
MTDIKYQARLQVLSQWATEAAGQGHLVPRIADLEAISAARTVDAPGVSREAVQPWLPTIQWLLKQAAFGVVDPHVQLPDELSRPVRAAHALQVVPPDENSADAPAPPAMELSLVAVVSPDTEHGSSHAAEAVTVIAEIKPAPPIAKGPKWESEAHEQVKDTREGKRTTAGGSRRRPLPFGAYWLKGTFSQLRTSSLSLLLPTTVNLT